MTPHVLPYVLAKVHQSRRECRVKARPLIPLQMPRTANVTPIHCELNEGCYSEFGQASVTYSLKSCEHA